MNRLILVFGLIFVMTFSALAQTQITEANYRIFDSKGNPATFEQVIAAIGGNDAVFLGENHDDAVGHYFQNEVFRKAYEKYGTTRKMALSLEMIESDLQVVVNEYLAGQITEKKFLDDSRPWGNYKTDYRPLVEFAKEKRLEIVAANAPRRYVNMVSRNGRESLNSLSKEAKQFLPPLPYAKASEAYSIKFKALMGSSPEALMGIDKILDSQSLWDAGMAYSVAKNLKKNKNGLVVHLNGGFHTEKRLGTIEHLLRYRPKTKALVVTMRYEDDFTKFDPAKHSGLGDFVVLTDAKIPRSKR